ncbi:hypothetical protein VTK56DRAFT_1834 [Thermocarpiscus australiensis]
MATRGSPRKSPQKMETTPDVIELSSDSEPEVDEVEDEEAEEAPSSAPNSLDYNDQPLLRAAGIKYKTDKPNAEAPPQENESTPSRAKSAVRAKDTGSAKYRHVSIEIPLPTSSELRRRKAEAEATDSQEGNDSEVFKTPSERKHITFDDSDHDEFATPMENPSGNPLESSAVRPNEAKGKSARGTQGTGQGEEEEEAEEEEESDDDAPPEAVSTREAEAQTLKAAAAAAKAAEQQAAAMKRKRQERDAFFKQQAEERKHAQQQARMEAEEADGASPGSREPTPEPADKRKREVPKLLPLELLESDDEDDSLQRTSSASGQYKRRKLGAPEQSLLREPRLPRDQRMGSTVYRVVAGGGDAKLAPKVMKQSLNLKETLLRRDRVAKPRGGFFVKKR